MTRRARYRLDGRTRHSRAGGPGWPNPRRDRDNPWAATLDTPEGGPLTLAPTETGRLHLASADATMGSLRLPPWLAIGWDDRVWLLARGEIRRLSSVGSFAPAPLPRRPRAPRMILAARSLYVLGRDELLVFDRRLRVTVQIAGLGDVIDAAVQDGGLLLLREGGRLDRLPAGAHWLERLPDLPAGPGYLRVLALKDGGRAFLTDAGAATVVGSDGRPEPGLQTAASLRTRTDPPAVRLDEHGRFALPPAMLTPCPRRGPVPPLDDPLAARLTGGRVFASDGTPVTADASDFAAAPVFQRSGAWMSDRLDGGRDGQVWGPGLLRLAALPPGTQFRVSAFSSDDPDALPASANPEILKDLFRPCVIHREPAQRGADVKDPDCLDFHVAGPPGRHLWLRVELAGDGRRTPAVRAVEVEFGQDRLIDMLPAEFQRQEQMRDHLTRLLALAETGLAAARDPLARRRLLLDPRLTASELLTEIEALTGATPDPRLPPDLRRRLLWQRLRSPAARGSRAGLHGRVTALLAALSGMGADDVAPLVQFVEGFRTRTTLRLGATAAAGRHRLAARSALSLDTGLTVGRDVLDSRTDPAVADFQHTAHRAELIVPYALAPDGRPAEMLTRALSQDMPAQVALTLTRPRGGVRLGAGPRLGLDTLLLDPRAIRLACAASGDGCGARLGLDAKLSPGDAPKMAIPLAPTIVAGGAARLP